MMVVGEYVWEQEGRPKICEVNRMKKCISTLTEKQRKKYNPLPSLPKVQYSHVPVGCEGGVKVLQLRKDESTV